MVTYSVPFYESAEDRNKKKGPIGVIPTDIYLDDLSKTMSALKLGKTGFGYILSKKGRFLYHPIFEEVKKKGSIFNLSKEPEYKHLEELARVLRDNKSKDFGLLKVTNKTTGQLLWISWHKIPFTEWTFVVNFPEEEQDLDEDRIRRLYIWLISTISIFLVFLFALLFKIHRLERVKWRFVIASSMIITAGVCGLWVVSKEYAPEGGVGESVKIVNKGGRNRFLKQQISIAHKKRTEDPVFIPTGVYVQSLEFKSANNVYLTGYVWQEYPKKPWAETERGFVFPEAVDISIDKKYARPSGADKEVIGWYFETTLRQPFDYSKYPFDNKDVWVRIWHQDFDKNVILTPFLESYELSSPSLKPGLDKNIVLPDWNIISSFFSYVPHSYSTNFGIETYIGQEKFPELYFTIKIQRKFLGPFVSSLLPFFVIMSLLFASVLNQKHGDIGGFLTAVGALLFTILLAHYSLRQKIESAGVVYFEYFYFIAYFAILVLTIATFMYHSSDREGILQYNDNIISKSLYWPTIMGILFIITAITFY